MIGPQCVWLVIVGGKVMIRGSFVTDPNITMIIELGKSVITYTILH